MKSVVIYYSYSGNTKRAALLLQEHLSAKGSADLVELETMDESRNFFVQCWRAFKRRRAQLKGIAVDLAQYDTICFTSPVWAFAPAPAMNAYLDACRGVAGKQVVLMTTYGSGTGNDLCLQYMQALLEARGVVDFKLISLPGHKTRKKDFVLAKIKEVMG